MNDLIERQDAIDLFLEKGMITAAIYVERMPSAQAERKTGRWIKDPQKSKFHIEPVYICSFCREQEAWGQMELSNYCPNCGAKMGEVTE